MTMPQLKAAQVWIPYLKVPLAPTQVKPAGAHNTTPEKELQQTSYRALDMSKDRRKPGAPAGCCPLSTLPTGAAVPTGVSRLPLGMLGSMSLTRGVTSTSSSSTLLTAALEALAGSLLLLQPPPICTPSLDRKQITPRWSPRADAAARMMAISNTRSTRELTTSTGTKPLRCLQQQQHIMCRNLYIAPDCTIQNRSLYLPSQALMIKHVLSFIVTVGTRTPKQQHACVARETHKGLLFVASVRRFPAGKHSLGCAHCLLRDPCLHALGASLPTQTALNRHTAMS